MPDNTDDLIRRIEADELADKLDAARDGTAKMSVREYAKVKGLEPQLVYYYIRNGKIDQEHCPCCGRKVIDVKSADEFFRQRDAKKGSLTSLAEET
jgi:hypothetical protein